MTADACRELRGDLAAVALGNAGPDERARVLAHTDGCAACRAELAELGAAARALDHVDPDRLADEPTVPRDLADAVLGRLHGEQQRVDAWRSRHRRVVSMRVAGAVAAAAAAILLVVALAGRGSTAPHVTVALDGRAHARLVRDTAGTEVHFDARGLHRGDRYWLWLTGPDGRRVGAGTFNGGTDGVVDVTTYCALPYDDVRRVWVTDATDRVVLDAWVTPRE